MELSFFFFLACFTHPLPLSPVLVYILGILGVFKEDCGLKRNRHQDVVSGDGLPSMTPPSVGHNLLLVASQAALTPPLLASLLTIPLLSS